MPLNQKRKQYIYSFCCPFLMPNALRPLKDNQSLTWVFYSNSAREREDEIKLYEWINYCCSVVYQPIKLLSGIWCHTVYQRAICPDQA